jgi:hypothetical protein
VAEGRDSGAAAAARSTGAACHSAQFKVLLEEYRQASEDWRFRDDYVERKFMQSTFYFTVVAAALGAAAAFVSEQPPAATVRVFSGVGLGLFLMMGSFTYSMLVSLIKDVAFRDGSQQLIIHLLDRLRRDYGVDTGRSILPQMRAEGTIDAPCEVILNQQEFPRKVRARPPYIAHLGIPDSFRDWLRKKHTFEHFVVFHVLALLGCVGGVVWMIWLLVNPVP